MKPKFLNGTCFTCEYRVRPSYPTTGLEGSKCPYHLLVPNHNSVTGYCDIIMSGLVRHGSKCPIHSDLTNITNTQPVKTIADESSDPFWLVRRYLFITLGIIAAGYMCSRLWGRLFG